MNNKILKFPNIILEGIGASGKTTISSYIQRLYDDLNIPYIVHHFQYPKGESNYEKYGYQHGQFDLMFDMISKFNNKGIAVILDRSWIGEYIWSPVYRNLTPAYLESLENDYNSLNNIIINVYAEPSIVLRRLLERKPNIAEDDPFFKQYDNPINAIEDIINKFQIIIKTRKDYNIRSFNFDASNDFDDTTKKKLLDLIIMGSVTNGI